MAKRNKKSTDAILVIKKPKSVKRDYLYLHKIDGGAEATLYDHMVDYADIDSIRIAASKVEKLYYACASLCGGTFIDWDVEPKYKDDAFILKYYKEIEAIFKELYPEMTSLKFSSYSSYNRFDNVRQNPDGMPNGFAGIVTADSDGLLYKFLKDHNISLHDFIMDNQYIVIVDSEYNWFERLKNHNIIDSSLIKEEYRIVAK